MTETTRRKADLGNGFFEGKPVTAEGLSGEVMIQSDRSGE
jgi:hypothetical protein